MRLLSRWRREIDDHNNYQLNDCSVNNNGFNIVKPYLSLGQEISRFSNIFNLKFQSVLIHF